MKNKKNVIFICTGNSCRSQMAEGILRDLAAQHFNVFSAGSHPSRVHPQSIAAMNLWGLDISSHTSDHVDLYLDRGMDIVITLCDNANEICPVFPGNVERIHWSIDDPFRNWDFNPQTLDPYLKTMETIKARLEDFLVKQEIKIVNSE